MFYVRATKDNQTKIYDFPDSDEADKVAGMLEAEGWTVFVF